MKYMLHRFHDDLWPVSNEKLHYDSAAGIMLTKGLFGLDHIFESVRLKTLQFCMVIPIILLKPESCLQGRGC